MCREGEEEVTSRRVEPEKLRVGLPGVTSWEQRVWMVEVGSDLGLGKAEGSASEEMLGSSAEKFRVSTENWRRGVDEQPSFSSRINPLPHDAENQDLLEARLGSGTGQRRDET